MWLELAILIFLYAGAVVLLIHVLHAGKKAVERFRQLLDMDDEDEDWDKDRK